MQQGTAQEATVRNYLAKVFNQPSYPQWIEVIIDIKGEVPDYYPRELHIHYPQLERTLDEGLAERITGSHGLLSHMKSRDTCASPRHSMINLRNFIFVALFKGERRDKLIKKQAF